MKTYEQLMTHYWGVIVPMAEAAGINAWECVKWRGAATFCDHPAFNDSEYTFALTVLEWKALFRGDKVFWKDGAQFVWGYGEINTYQTSLTWTPPAKKRTFMLGDKELACPEKVFAKHKNVICIKLCDSERHYDFESLSDANDLFMAITGILNAARDKD